VTYFPLSVGWILLALIPVAWCAPNNGAAGIEPLVRLRDAIEVKQKRVWLSDLLPADAPAALQQISAAIQLCPAPEPGSTRILSAEQVTSKLVGQMDVRRQLTIPSLITVRYAGWPITDAMVRIAISKFLREMGVERDLPDGARLEWLQPFAANEEHPRLKVMGLEWDNRQQAVEARLRCATRASCSRFLVRVDLPAPIANEWHRLLKAGTGLNSPGAVATVTAGMVLAEKGKPAILILDDGGMRISLPVICLQRGVLNQHIRVIDTKSRRVFRAEVVGAGELHATL